MSGAASSFILLLRAMAFVGWGDGSVSKALDSQT